jgi:hypothetical protein
MHRAWTTSANVNTAMLAPLINYGIHVADGEALKGKIVAHAQKRRAAEISRRSTAYTMSVIDLSKLVSTQFCELIDGYL